MYSVTDERCTKNNYPLLASQRETSSHSSLSQNSDSSLVSNDIREVFEQFPHGITNNKFGKLVLSKNLKEVTVKGNGFCFLSCLLITLAEQGINKTVNVLCVEIDEVLSISRMEKQTKKYTSNFIKSRSN